MVDGEITPEEREKQLANYVSDNGKYEGLVITIEDDVADGMWAEFFSDINQKRKDREDWFDRIKKPLNEALKILNAQEHLAIDRLKEIEYTITQARGAWMQVKNKKIAEANAAAIADAGESGGVAIVQQKVAKTVHIASGASVGLKTLPSWRLVDDPSFTAKHISDNNVKLDRADPRLKNVPDNLFILQPGLVMAAIKTGILLPGEHSIEKYESYSSTSK